MKTCTTHHHACDCREKILKEGLVEIGARLGTTAYHSGFDRRTLKMLNDLWRKLYGEDLIK